MAPPTKTVQPVSYTPTDAIYRTTKDNAVAAGTGKTPTTTFAETPATELALDRSFVYGLDYIDEVVAQVMPDGKRRWVLQDANYNVVGLAL